MPYPIDTRREAAHAVARAPENSAAAEFASSAAAAHDAQRPIELGGPTGPEPTRYGDWEKRGRCIDF